METARRMRDGVLDSDGGPESLKTDGDAWYVAQSGTIRRYNLLGRELSDGLDRDAAELARDRGLGLLRVDCYGGDDRALVRFYEGCGFTATDRFTVERPGRPPWPGQVLERRLG
ncbi:hypothetical protein GCM10027452_44480 [Micromonospora halotolerans]